MTFSPLNLAVILVTAILLISHLTAVSKAAWVIVCIIAILLALFDWNARRVTV